MSAEPTQFCDGDWFSAWLDRRRFTDSDIADRLGVSPATIWRWKKSPEQLAMTVILALRAIDDADIAERVKASSGGK
jgi:transcriptional regulator with XRE-family HTH domain